MLVTIQNEQATSIDIQADVTWTAAVARAHGEAQLKIPRASVAWDANVITERAGFMVGIQTRWGPWWGIADKPTYTPSGLSVTVRGVSNWLGIRRLVRPVTFHGLTAGALARHIYTDAIAGLGGVPVTLGKVLDAPPVINIFEFRKQTALAALEELASRSGQEWELDEGFRLNWVPRQGRHHELWITDDGSLFDSISLGSLSDRTAEAIETAQDGREFRVHANESPATWPKQEVVRI
jgi:hypothetical protein